MTLSKYERETIINFNEEEKTATVYTMNKRLLSRLAKIAEQRPDECKLDRLDADGEAATYVLPKKWIKVNPSRIVSEEEHQRLAERARANAKALWGRG